MADAEKTPSEHIDERIAELGDWRGELLAEGRRLLLVAGEEAGEPIVEEWKWRGVPTWYGHGKIVTTGETYKGNVKLALAEGASLDDPNGLFNASLEGNARRAIDLFEGDGLDAEAFTALVVEALKANAG
ncbi:hypothetical protein USB125703_00698 [Pseudoclavibacter triregionum]|nr:hypothetical protein USB125703_00698 [Pseudoclavibacter triregionum]